MTEPDTPSRSQLPVPVEQYSQRLVRAAPPASQNTPEGLTPAFLLWVFGQWWKFVIPAGLVLAAAVGIIVYKAHVPLYQASAMIMIQKNAPYVAFQEESGGGETFVQTQIELLRSVVLRSLLTRPEIAALEELKLEADPEAHLRENLTISRVGKSELYDVTYTSPSPQAAKTVANSIVLEYLNMQLDNEVARSKVVVDLLEDERRRRSLEVERLRNRVVGLAKQLTGKDPFGNEQFTDVEKALSPIANLHHSLTDVEVNIEVLKAEIQALQDAPIIYGDQTRAAAILKLEIENHPEVTAVQSQMNDIEEKMELLSSQLVKPDSNRHYLDLRDLLTEREQILGKTKADLREIIQNQRKQERETGRATTLASLKNELQRLATRKKLLAKRYQKHLTDLQDGSAKSVELEFAQAELAREERIFELIAERKLALQTEMRAPPRVSMRQEASIPQKPVEAIPTKLLLLGCASAFVAPFGLVVVSELLNRRVSTSDQLRSETSLRVVGEIARYPVRPVASSPRSLPSRLRREMYIFAESIDSLRTNLFLSSDFSDGRTLVVTSATSGEGKTSLATALGVSIAEATKQKTLIIDADMRSPDVDNVLGVKASPGLAELLAGRCSHGEAVHQVGTTDTYVMPAGRAKTSPHHLVQKDSVERLLEKLKEEFRTIVIDTPPVLGASESLVFANAVDGVLYCSLSDVSRVHQVRHAVDRLEHSQARVLGAVLGGMPVSRYSYVYGYYSSRPQRELLS